MLHTRRILLAVAGALEWHGVGMVAISRLPGGFISGIAH